MDWPVSSYGMANMDQAFAISRDFVAPRTLVWQAWTDPECMAQWWGSKGYTMLSSKPDLRPHGTYHYGMRSPTGQEMWDKWSIEKSMPRSGWS